MFIIDGHLDLAMNAMEWNRDLRLPVKDMRNRELGMNDKPDRANGTVSFPELRKGNIGIVVATQIARYVKPGSAINGWNSPEQAWAQTQAQLAWYKAMESVGELFQIHNLASLEKHFEYWNDGNPLDDKSIGYILSLEGADSLVDIGYLEKAHADGLRAVGPAHYREGRYANGTDSKGKMDEQGLSLLKEMERLNVILDATHLCDDAFWQALDHFGGPVWASHNNCRAFVDHNRQFSDDQILALISRGAVIGAAADAWMLVPDWKRGVSNARDMKCSIEQIADNIDHVCQLAGNPFHAGIGSDLGGAYGTEQTPYDLETISDLQKLHLILASRGYSTGNVEHIFHKNWLSFLRKAWKEGS
ncbi:MAG: membrane dipeptidase [Bacteroidota bacterium]